MCRVLQQSILYSSLPRLVDGARHVVGPALLRAVYVRTRRLLNGKSMAARARSNKLNCTDRPTGQQ